MKSIFTIVFIITTVFAAFSQTWGTAYCVQFKDKNNSPYQIDMPNEFLSQRAIDRRAKSNISINETDIPVNQSYINELTNKTAIILNKSRWFNNATIFLADTTKIHEIRNLSCVKSVTEIRPYFENLSLGSSLPATITLSNSNPQNTVKPKNYNYGNGFNQASMISVDYLHQLGYNGSGMVIAVIDAGYFNVDRMDFFKDFVNSGRLLGTKDFVEHNGDVFRKSTHGMMVLSTMAGNKPGQLVGTAPGASYWLLRSEDGGSEYLIEEYNWVAAAEFADSVGADIINSSLGYTEFDDPRQGHFYSELDGNTAFITLGADMAAAKGILVVNSAGNSGNSQWKHIGAPADADSILTVGAVTANRIYANFSSIGPTADGRKKPTISTQGQNSCVVSSVGEITNANGTSFSSPIMAGAAASLWQTKPQATNMEIIDAICKSADKYKNQGNLYGYGIPNMAAAHLILNDNLKEETDKDYLLASPNPFLEDIHVIFHSNVEQSITIQITTQNGKKIWEKKDYFMNEGYNHLLIEKIKSLSKGVYILNCITSKNIVSKKIIKQ